MVFASQRVEPAAQQRKPMRIQRWMLDLAMSVAPTISPGLPTNW
jgi:hypothetical protein